MGCLKASCSSLHPQEITHNKYMQCLRTRSLAAHNPHEDIKGALITAFWRICSLQQLLVVVSVQHRQDCIREKR